MEKIDIKDYEGLYAVTKDGKVWSYPKISSGKYANRNKSGMWMSGNIHNGYRVICLCKDKTVKRVFTHRLILEAFIPNPENKPFCNHKDCNPLNNHVDNLEWCTNQENIIHAYANGLMNISEKMRENAKIYGIKNQHFTLKATRKFTMQQVDEIKESYQRLGVFAQVGRLFNCSAKTIEKIVNNKSYTKAA